MASESRRTNRRTNRDVFNARLYRLISFSERAAVLSISAQECGFSCMLPLRMPQEFRILVEHTIAAHGGAQPTAMNTVKAFSINGHFDRDRLARCLDIVISRHEALRLRVLRNPFVSDADWGSRYERFQQTWLFQPGLFAHHFTERAHVRMHEQRLHRRGTVADDVSDAVHQFARTHVDCTADWHITALLLDAEPAPILALVIPHLAVDGWSMTLLQRELELAYAGEDFGQVLPPHQGPSWSDFVGHELAAILDGQHLAALRYWHDQWRELRHAQISHCLIPFRLPSVGASLLDTQCIVRELDGQTATAVRQCARTLQVTPHAVFRAAWAIALAALTGAPSVGTWCNMANRNGPGRDTVVGWLSNRHFLNVAMNNAARCDDVVLATNRSIREALTHQALPLQVLWNCLGQRLDMPTDHTYLLMDYFSDTPTTGDDTRFVTLALDRCPWRVVDLELRVRRVGTAYRMVVSYDPRRYSNDGVACLVDRFSTTIETITSCPSTPVAACTSAT
jgi:condensation domain-containing protein